MNGIWVFPRWQPWYRLHLPMHETQETWVQSQGQEDPLEEAWQPTPGFLPGESHGQGAWCATVHGVMKSWTWLSTHAHMQCYMSGGLILVNAWVYFFFNFFFFCSEFCHTLKWKGLGFTCLPHPDPPSHLPPHPLPPGPPRAPGPSACLIHPTRAGNLFNPW